MKAKSSATITRNAPGDAPPRRAHALDDLRAGTTKSLNAALIEQLRTDLLSGRIAPNLKLKIPDICTRYSVSPGVAREALSRLVPEGLVDFTDQRGFRTPPLTAMGMRDITRVRLLIEREALVDAMQHGTDSWEAHIVGALHRLQSYERAAPADAMVADSEDWSRRHREFHQALISACTSPWLIKLHNILYDQTERYRFIAARAGNAATGRRRNTLSEHTQIVEAVLERDEHRAVKLMEQHLLRTADRALAAADFDGDALT